MYDKVHHLFPIFLNSNKWFGCPNKVFPPPQNVSSLNPFYLPGTSILPTLRKKPKNWNYFNSKFFIWHVVVDLECESIQIGMPLPVDCPILCLPRQLCSWCFSRIVKKWHVQFVLVLRDWSTACLWFIPTHFYPLVKKKTSYMLSSKSLLAG